MIKIIKEQKKPTNSHIENYNNQIVSKNFRVVKQDKYKPIYTYYIFFSGAEIYEFVFFSLITIPYLFNHVFII